MRGSVPLAVSLALTLIVVTVAWLACWLMPALQNQFWWVLPSFAGVVTLGALRASVPARFHAAWATVFFPMLLGAVILIGFILAANTPETPSGKSGSFLWMMPFVIACTTSTRSGGRIACGAWRVWLAIVLVTGLVPVAIAASLVWKAVEQKSGPVYASLMNSMTVSGAWTLIAMLIGWSFVLTKGFRETLPPAADTAN